MCGQLIQYNPAEQCTEWTPANVRREKNEFLGCQGEHKKLGTQHALCASICLPSVIGQTNVWCFRRARGPRAMDECGVTMGLP